MERVDKNTIIILKRYVARLRISYTDWWRYYGLSANILDKIKQKDLDFLDVTKKEYKSIKEITKDKKSLLNMVLTDKIVRRLKRVVNEFGLEETAKEIGRPKELLEEIMKKKTKTIEIIVKEKIARFYNEITKEESDEILARKCSRVNVEEVVKREKENTIRANRLLFRQLEIGKSYKIFERRYKSERYTKELIFEGKITKEYRSYYLATNNGRNVTFLKNMLYMKDIVVKEIKNDRESQVPKRIYA